MPGGRPGSPDVGAPRRTWADAVLLPGSWLMRRLRFAGKFAAIAAVLLVALASSTAGLIAVSSTEVRTIGREHAGVEVIVSLDRLLIELVRHLNEHTTDGLAGGHTHDFQPALSAVQQAVEDEHLPDSLRSEWRAYRADVRALAASPEQPHTEDLVALVQEGAALVDRAGVASSLTLDGASHSFELQRVLVRHVPRLLRSAASLRLRAEQQSRTPAEDRSALVTRASVEVAVTATSLHEAMSSPAFARLQAGTVPAVQVARELAAHSDFVARSVHLAAADGLAGTTSTADPTDPPDPTDTVDLTDRADASRVVDAVGQILEPVSAELARTLDQRLEQAEGSRRTPLVSTGVALALTIYLLLAVGRSTLRELRAVTDDLESAAAATPLPERAVTGRDELTTIARVARLAHGRIRTLVQDLQRTTRHHQALIENSSDVIVVTGPDGVISYASGSLRTVLGLDPADFVGRHVREMVEAEDQGLLEAVLGAIGMPGDGATQVTLRVRNGDGTPRFLQARISDRTGDADINGVLWNARDVTDEQALSSELRHRAFHDDLSGLPNRALFLERVGVALGAAPAAASWTAVCVLDIDAFKGVNDSLGHAAGDELLRACAGRLGGLLRDGDTVARLGGDEFGVLISSLVDSDAAIAVARRLRNAVALPVQLAGQRARVTISVGVTLVEPGRETTIDQVLHQADVAMYAAKAAGPGRIRVFTSGMLPAGAETTYDELQAVIEEDGAIQPVFQPLMDLSTGTLVGYEALARFPGRDHRQVDEWFGLARSSGCGPALEAKAIRAALGVPDRPPGTYLALNVSPATLTSDAIAEVLPADLRNIVIEITEDSDIETFELTEVLADLRSRGALIAIDDAGSGYAGLRRLTSLQPDIVKLDRQLIHDIADRPEKAALVEAMVGYCRRTGSTLVAEGIETVSELIVLADLDVAVGQGWAIGRPGTGWRPASAEASAACNAAYVGAVSGTGSAAGLDGAETILSVRARLAAANSMLDVCRALRLLAAGLGAADVVFSWLDGGHLVTAPENDWILGDERYALADFPASAACLSTLEPLQIRSDDPGADAAELLELTRVGLGGVLLVPVAQNGEALGLLEVYSEDPRNWTREELKLIHGAAELVATIAARERSTALSAAAS